MIINNLKWTFLPVQSFINFIDFTLFTLSHSYHQVPRQELPMLNAIEYKANHHLQNLSQISNGGEQGPRNRHQKARLCQEPPPFRSRSVPWTHLDPHFHFRQQLRPRSRSRSFSRRRLEDRFRWLHRHCVREGRRGRNCQGLLSEILFAFSYSAVIATQLVSVVLQISINRPERRNAFRPKTVKELMRAFTDARDDSSVGVVILTGKVPPSPFSEFYLLINFYFLEICTVIWMYIQSIHEFNTAIYKVLYHFKMIKFITSIRISYLSKYNIMNGSIKFVFYKKILKVLFIKVIG